MPYFASHQRILPRFASALLDFARPLFLPLSATMVPLSVRLSHLCFIYLLADSIPYHLLVSHVKPA
jgi:hypothetical protein